MVDRLVGLVVKVSASSAANPGLVPALGVDLFPGGVNHTSDFTNGTPVATLRVPGVPGSALGQAWCQ